MDKYAEKRPARSRACIRADGVLKRRLRRDEAERHVRERWDVPLVAYKCADCGWYHVGHRGDA